MSVQEQASPALSTPWVPLWPLTPPSTAGWKGQWLVERAYVTGDLVAWAGAVYQALIPSTGVTPDAATSAMTWVKLADSLASAKAFYRLADTGATAADSSGLAGGAGTFQGTVTKDVAGASAGSKCVEFNGSTGYIQVPNAVGNSGLGPSPGWSISAWLYATAVRNTAGQSSGIVAKEYTSGNIPFALGYGPETGGPIANGIWAGRFSGGWVFAVDPNPLPLTTWAHYVGVQDATTVRLYKNGVQVASAAGAPVAQTGNQMFLGKRWDASFGAQGFFPGRIDDLRLYAYPLSATDVAALYADGAK